MEDRQRARERAVPGRRGRRLGCSSGRGRREVRRVQDGAEPGSRRDEPRIPDQPRRRKARPERPCACGAGPPRQQRKQRQQRQRHDHRVPPAFPGDQPRSLEDLPVGGVQVARRREARHVPLGEFVLRSAGVPVIGPGAAGASVGDAAGRCRCGPVEHAPGGSARRETGEGGRPCPRERRDQEDSEGSGETSSERRTGPSPAGPAARREGVDPGRRAPEQDLDPLPRRDHLERDPGIPEPRHI